MKMKLTTVSTRNNVNRNVRASRQVDKEMQQALRESVKIREIKYLPVPNNHK